MAKKNEVMVAPSAETLAALKQEFPQADSYQKIRLPRLSLISQDITEEKKNPATGKKEISIITEAGTFMLERETEEVDPETGKPIWSKEDLGDSVEATILYQRKQLRYYDSADEKFTSSPVYDSADETVVLFCDGKEVDRGTPKELQAKYPQGKTAAGKPKPLLEENKVLYVLFNDEVFQMTVRGSSMYSFLDFARKVNPPAALTKLSSEAKENGSIKWNQMTFTQVRPLNEEEATRVLGLIRDLKIAVAAEKAQYSNDAVQVVARGADESDEDYEHRKSVLAKF